MRLFTKDHPQNKTDVRKYTTRDLAELGMMVAALEAGKLALSSLPNVEIVTFLIIMFAIVYGLKSMIAVVVFIGVECLIWPVNLWTIMYLYTWPLLAVLAYLCRKQNTVWFWSIFSALYGFCFGALCAVVYIFTSGIHTAVVWWLAGITFDLLHGFSNFAIMLILYRPIRKVFSKYHFNK